MRILVAGNSNQLMDTLESLRATDPEACIVGQALNEGELLLEARSLQPELILLPWSFRSRLTSEWAAYLSAISGGARIMAVYTPDHEGG